jgi:hypothetical protein
MRSDVWTRDIGLATLDDLCSQHSLQKQASCAWHAVGSPLLPVCSRRVKLTIMDKYSHGGKTMPGFTRFEVLIAVSLNIQNTWMFKSRYYIPKFAGSNPAEAVRFLKAKKILSTPSFGGEVKPSVPCRRFVACKRSLQLRGSRIVDGICRTISRPRRVPPSAARGLSRRWTWRHLAEKVGTSKGRGKQWQSTPKNLPRMQWASAIPVAWLGSGSC